MLVRRMAGRVVRRTTLTWRDLRGHPPVAAFPGPSGSQFRVLSVDPIVVFVQIWFDEAERYHNLLEPLLESLRAEPVVVFMGWLWNIDERERVAAYRRVERWQRRRRKRHRFVHLCNTEAQVEEFRRAGLTASLCSGNAFIDERVFVPVEVGERPFDAVIDARLKAYKRHELAAAVPRLAATYVRTAGIEDDREAAVARAAIGHAQFFNDRPDGTYRNLSVAEVNAVYGQARVGLALSAVEGWCTAAVQYLLAGLPVVSTASRGGRDLFFDRLDTRIVAADPVAVRDAVLELGDAEVSRSAIRDRALARVLDHRGRFVDLVQSVYDEAGVARSFASEWPAFHTQGLLRRTPFAEALASIRSGRLSPASTRAEAPMDGDLAS